MNMESIKGKIQKLLALSRDEGASEQEAQLALQRAHELLSKYNLAMSPVPLATSISFCFIDGFII